MYFVYYTSFNHRLYADNDISCFAGAMIGADLSFIVIAFELRVVLSALCNLLI